MNQALLSQLTVLIQKQLLLDRRKPLKPALIQNLTAWFDVELTYTSNAIEGNTLTRQETALVVEKDITVGGKTLREHLEARNHQRALEWVRTRIVAGNDPLTERDALDLHAIVLSGIDDTYAGRYRDLPVRVSGSQVLFPNPAKIAELMGALFPFITAPDDHPVIKAADLHYELVTIHPFIDGNGRTARLLMNCLLMQHGYIAAIIDPKDRLAYVNSLEQAQLGGTRDDFYLIVAQAAERSLDMYLEATE